MRVFRNVELVEHLGSGIPRILQSYGKECFKFSDNFLRMTFPAVPRKYRASTVQVTPQVPRKYPPSTQQVTAQVPHKYRASTVQVPCKYRASRRTC